MHQRSVSGANNIAYHCALASSLAAKGPLADRILIMSNPSADLYNIVGML